MYGCANHPLYKVRGSGGKYGGDAVLLAMRFVNAAICVDDYWSFRCPSLVCGIYSLRLTSTRIDQNVIA